MRDFTREGRHMCISASKRLENFFFFDAVRQAGRFSRIFSRARAAIGYDKGRSVYDIHPQSQLQRRIREKRKYPCHALIYPAKVQQKADIYIVSLSLRLPSQPITTQAVKVLLTSSEKVCENRLANERAHMRRRVCASVSRGTIVTWAIIGR